MDKRLAEIRRLLILILLLNLGVSLAKLIYGFRNDILSMAADGFHSLLDASSNVIGLIGVTLAAKPPDSTHPYGHRKFETFSALAIAFLMVFAGYAVLREATSRFFNHHHYPSVSLTGFLVMIVTLVINFFVAHYELKKGRELKSELLIADSYHTRSDIYASFAVIASLISVKLGFPLLDEIVALFIVFLIGRAAFSIVREGIDVLSDSSRIDPQEIRKVVNSTPGVLSCHRVRTRGTADCIQLDLHLELEGDLNLERVHRISHQVEERLRRHFPALKDVVIHPEPPHDEAEI